MNDELIAARAADSMAFLSDVERKAREACNYEVSDAYQNAWLVIRDLQTALARVKELCDTRPYLNSELLVAQVYRALGIDPYSKEPAASPAPAPPTPPAEARELVERADYAAMSSSKMLEALGDAQFWAEAFCQIAKKQGHDIDEGWVIGWFANAIEHSSDVRKARAGRFKDAPAKTAEEGKGDPGRPVPHHGSGPAEVNVRAPHNGPRHD